MHLLKLNTDNEGTSPKTGDSIETIGYAVLLGLTGGALALAGKSKKTQLML